MVRESDLSSSGGSERGNVADCSARLKVVISELARCYGAAAVVVALTEIVGCAACAKDGVERGTSIRGLIARIGTSPEDKPNQ